MRRILIPSLILLTALGHAQSWEKLVAPGMSYRMEVDLRAPRLTHVLRWSMGTPDIFARAELSRQQIFTGNSEESREEMSQLLKETDACAAINADFFGKSGEPLGAMVRNGELVSRPFPNRPAFGWGPNSTAFGKLDWFGSIFFEVLGRKPFTGLNEDVPQNALALFTNSAKYARAPLPNAMVIVKFDQPRWAPTSLIRGEVKDVVTNVEQLEVPKDCAVIVATGTSAEEVSKVRRLEKLTVSMRTDGFEWSKIDNVVGGGPNLMSSGKVNINYDETQFGKAFSETRHPRTAVGRAANGDVFFVIVDGRQPMSIGSSLPELATTMQGLGCVDAINLDGGGSSTLSIFGEVLNRPSDGRERRVANGILFFGPKMPENKLPFVIQGPAMVSAKSVTSYTMIGPTGNPMPDREVLWSAMGEGGWVDQGGNVRALDAGVIRLRAYSQGVVANLVVTVTPTETKTPK